MTYSTNQTISLLEKLSNEMEMKFKSPLPVKIKGTYCLMFIKYISLDGAGKLFMKDGRGKESEITDQLIYHEQILKTINDEISPIFSPLVVVDEVKGQRVLIVDKVN